MWIIAFLFAACVAVHGVMVGVRAVRDVLGNLPRSNQDWVWY